MPAIPDAIAIALRELLVEAREHSGLTMDDLAARAGVDRTYVGRLEAGRRQPTLAVAIALAAALGRPLSEFLTDAEAKAEREAGTSGGDSETRRARSVDAALIEATADFTVATGLGPAVIVQAIQDTYTILDTLDNQLARAGAPPFSQLVELANLSSMVGNIVGGAIAKHSGELFERSGPHKYQDLRSTSGRHHVEIKTALESNRPKGHLAKAGYYLTFRYVLCNARGDYERGKDQRGTVVYIWEVRFGWLEEEDFSISNTDGDSGKTAVVKIQVFQGMERLYFDPDRCPYVRLDGPWGYAS